MDDQEANAKVITRSNRGQWENHVEGHPELSRSFSSREEAVDAGARLAAARGFTHEIVPAEPTGAITDTAAPIPRSPSASGPSSERRHP